MQKLNVPELGGSTPRRGNRLTSWAGRTAMRWSGWRFAGRIPDVAKAVLIVAPHSSNWDFFIGVAAMFSLGVRVVFWGKHTLFVWPLGPVMRWLGGFPVDRRSTAGVVDVTVRRFAESDQMILALAPEGTRSAVQRWKTGFYHVAVAASVPVIPVVLDWGSKTIRFGDRFDTTGDIDRDFSALKDVFSDAEGRRSH
ncbi:MAG: lysophospholipid acyltransferase family protein [Candidatus Sulfomarinibacteraceae bacterium]